MIQVKEKTLLQAHLPGSQISGFRSAARHSGGSIAERCSASRVRYAADNTAAPLTPVRRSARNGLATGGSDREPDTERGRLTVRITFETTAQAALRVTAEFRQIHWGNCSLSL